MKKLVIIFSLFINLIVISTHAQWQWASTVSDSGNGMVYGMVVDEFDNIYTTGYYMGGMINENDTILGYGYEDIFVAKYNSSGHLQWLKTAGGLGEDRGRGISLDNYGNVYVAGSFYESAQFEGNSLVGNGLSDIFLVKYDNSGNLIWAKSWGSEFTDVASCLVTNNTGSLFMTGWVMSGSSAPPAVSNYATINLDTTTLTSHGDGDVFIAKLDTEGNMLWVNSCGGKFGDFSSALAVDEIDNIYITGTAGPYKAYFDNDSLVNKGTFIAKYDSSGHEVWVRGIERQNFGIYGTSIAVDGQGNVFAGGHSAPLFTPKIFEPGVAVNECAYIAKYSSTGDLLWAKGIGDVYYTGISSLVLDNAGNAYFTGYFNHKLYMGSDTIIGFGNDDIFLNKYDTDGNRIWTLNAGGLGNDQGNALAFDSQGDLLMGGFIASAPAYFGNIEASSMSMRDMFVAKFSPPYASIEDNLEQEVSFSIYPNPSSGYININCDPHSFDTMTLLNAQGQAIFSANISGNDTYFKLPELPNGMYAVLLNGKSRQVSRVLILQTE